MTRPLRAAAAAGGRWSYALALARALVPHGRFPTLATRGPRRSADRLEAAADMPRLEVVSGDFQLEWTHDPWNDIEAAGSWLLDLEARVNPVIVHINGYAHGSLPWRAPVVVVGHSCVQSWAEAVGEPIDRTW